jgi:hypothetical protein
MIYQNSSAKKPVGETLSPSSNVLAKEETASQAAKKLNGRGKGLSGHDFSRAETGKGTARLDKAQITRGFNP